MVVVLYAPSFRRILERNKQMKQDSKKSDAQQVCNKRNKKVWLKMNKETLGEIPSVHFRSFLQVDRADMNPEMN